jgi:hypothetical protein
MLGTDVGAFIASKYALDRSLFGTGVGNPGDLDGPTIDRFAKRPLHLSGKIQAGWKATMASGHTLTVTVKLRHSTDDSTYTDVDGASGVTVISALNAGGAQRGVVEQDVNLIGCHQYIKVRVTPVLSASGSDAAEVFGLLAVGGGETVPPVETT